MRWNRFTAVGCIVALAASVLLARVHPFGDAALNPQRDGTHVMDLTDISPNVRETLVKES